MEIDLKEMANNTVKKYANHEQEDTSSDRSEALDIEADHRLGSGERYRQNYPHAGGNATMLKLPTDRYVCETGEKYCVQYKVEKGSVLIVYVY